MEGVKPLATHPGTRPVADALTAFTGWLTAFGETSYDHQTFFAGPAGRRAKSLYYRHKLLGTLAVGPMIFCEAFVPSARRFFHQKTRFPIADAHYAMGFAFLSEATGRAEHLARAVHFLEVLKATRSPGFPEFAWGYPFDWVTRNGTIPAWTPFITSTPYMYEAFRHVHQLVATDSTGPESLVHHPQSSALRPLASEFKEIMASIVRHVYSDFRDFPASPTASTCAYSPQPSDQGGVINAAAYRAGMLAMAALDFGNDEYWRIGERNLNFVLENQNPDGSWYYAVDGVRDFVDHFHTCFVMKALAKIHTLTGHAATLTALERGVDYYLNNLFATDGLPKPFSKAPRLTVYECELYDCAEAINLCLLLRNRFPQLQGTLETLVALILRDWITPAGSFRARKLKLGWDNVPMHRWAQSQMFRALAFYLREHRAGSRAPAVSSAAAKSDLVARN